MILRMDEFFKAVERLHQLELYDDLHLLAELHLPSEPSKMFMNCEELEEDQRGYLLCCLANAHAQLNHFPQAIRNYEMAIRYLGTICKRKLLNRYEHVLNTAEIRYQMYKLFMQNKQEEDALHCLESIPRTELTPKVLLAMARLCHQMAKMPSQSTRSLFNKRVDAPNTRIVNYFKAIVKDVPEAIYCKSYLLSVGALKNITQQPGSSSVKSSPSIDDNQSSPENENISQTIETKIWMEAKMLQAQKLYLEAAKLLDNMPSGTNLRFLLEQARLYRIAGDQQKALACYQQAHLLDSTNVEGMDTFAALLGTHSNSQQTQRELDLLAHKMWHANPRRPESYIVYGWSQRQCHRVGEAKQFALRAEQLAQKRGRQRCEALLLRAQLLYDTKRHSHYKEMEMVLADALHNDSTNTAVYTLYIQTFIAQKRFAEAQRMAKTSMKFVGEQNHQIRFLFAQTLADDPTGGYCGTEQAISILEKMVQEGTFLTLDPLLLLSRLYERQHKFEKAISLLNRFKESYGDPRIHRELGDLLSRTNRPNEALGEYSQAIGTNGNDSTGKDKMIKLMSGFTTPQCAANAAFENSTTAAAVIAGEGSSSTTMNAAASTGNARMGTSVIRMPPPVARITRRTAINQHEQLRRLRGMSTFSATGSMGSNGVGGRAQARRVTRASSGISSGTSNGLSPVLAPLRFDSDPRQQNNRAANNDSSGDGEGSDSSQVSLDEDEVAGIAEHSNNSSRALEQSRASNVSGSVAAAANSVADQTANLRHMVRDIQRYLASNRSGTPTTTSSSFNPSASSAQRTPVSPHAMPRMTTTTTVQQGSSLGLVAGVEDDNDFMPLIADEPLLESDMHEDEESRMSIDNSDDPGMLVLSDDDEMN